ncbi:unnamed protein product [Allacma fusca]|uniref:C2H2-type domain-containing protein n=1 Tax=Allacma fusca TaxID=39272 RepID=A0A8J2PB14_9HEXA|nr:unnamed protein product [Allacma fusca]
MSTHKGNFQVLTLEEKKFMLPSPFRRKVESLDWKKIASTDIEKIVQTSNIEALEEFFGQITHCRPEIEFESSSDSGFLKCTQLEEQNAALTLELQTLKDGLSAAKKELRRRKELLVSAQNEVVGDNRDEYDPCPYCSKRFLTTSYLMAHMQRRHQGLPFQPPFPTQNVYHGFAPKYPEKDYNPMQISPGQPSKQLLL